MHENQHGSIPNRSVPGSAAPVPRSPIEADIQELHCALMQLEATAEELDEQLGWVKNYNRVAHAASDSQGPDELSRSNGAEQIISTIRRVRCVQGRLSLLREALEV